MGKGFTMIELIFVIVIIGILASIAIPKLAATSNDAKGTKIVHSLSVCIMDAGSYYMTEGTFGGRAVAGSNQTANCKIADECFDFQESDSNGSLVVTDDTSKTDAKCAEAQRIANRNLLIRNHIIHF